MKNKKDWVCHGGKQDGAAWDDKYAARASLFIGFLLKDAVVDESVCCTLA